jgi:uncharacterized phage infection (PIP) family protein YhgE
VSTIEAVSAGLAAMSNGVDKARQATAAADEAAQKIATRSAATGFTGIAQNLSRLRAAIKEIQTGITAVNTPVSEASASVAAVPKQATPQEALGVLEPVTQKLDGVQAAVAAVMERIAKAQQLAASILQGGQAAPMLARLDTIRQTVHAIAQRIDQTRTDVAQALAAARKTGDQGT